MDATYYRNEMTQVKQQAEQHACLMETKEYTSSADLLRDMAIGTELYQRYTDLLGEMVDDKELLPNSDYISVF